MWTVVYGGFNMNINWQNPDCAISKYFKVREALLLPKFGIMHVPNEQEQWNIYFLAGKLDIVREYIGRPIQVHCFIRPVKINAPGTPYHEQNYNQLVGGAQNSAHIYGNACDFNFEGRDTAEGCQEMRDLLIPKLADFGLRMEDRIGPWLHMDRNKVPAGGNYYFIP